MPRNPLLKKPAAVEPQLANAFHRYGLECNPFPDRPGVTPGGLDPRSNGSIYVESIRAVQEARFNELLVPKPQLSTRAVAFLMDTATRHGRGIGKTAFLNRQHQRIIDDLDQGSDLTGGRYPLFAVHVIPTSGNDTRKFWQFARLVLAALNDQEIIARAIWRIRAYSGRIPESVLDEAESPATTIGDNEWLLKKGIVAERDLNPWVEEQLSLQGATREFATLFARYAHSSEAFRTHVLRATTDYRWRQVAGTWLASDLVAAFRLAGLTRGLLLIDDFEKVVRGQNLAERRAFVDDVRAAFIDGQTVAARTHFFSLLLVIYPYIQELLLPHWNAAGLGRFAALEEERASDYRIDFPPLDVNATEALVCAYIKKARTLTNSQPPLWPLDRPALETAYKLTRGLPGHLLSWLHLAFQQGAKDGWPAIDSEQLTAFAKAQPPSFVDDGSDAPKLAPVAVDLKAGEA